MTFVTDLRKTVADATPLYAAVGVTDAAAARLRDARHQAVVVRKNLTTIDAKDLQKGIQDAPAAVLERTLELAGKAQGQYDAFAARGEELVKSIRTQKATKDLVAQAETTVALGKGAVTTVRKAVAGTQSSAKATITTGRHQAGRVADVVGGVVVRDAKEAATSVQESAATIADATESATAATASAAKRTRTTARKGAQASATRAKAANTSARKSAPRARKATKAAAGKVGA